MMATCRESGKVPLCGVGRKGNAAWDLRPCLQILYSGRRGMGGKEREEVEGESVHFLQVCVANC